MKYLSAFAAIAMFALTATGCKDEKTDEQQQTQITEETPKVNVPAFNADSAYVYIQRQLDFGPRVPGTPAQKEAAAWMEQKLQAFCDTVYRQETHVRAGNGQMLPCINLIGSINPQASRRILLMTHWDSRPWADMDENEPNKPVMAADDGASGVGVLLELARQIQNNPLPADIGIDIFFTDVEDYGKTEWGENSYALGTQYWAHNPHIAGYDAEFGILLDMVGARGATFPMEGISSYYAPDVQKKIWNSAVRAGYSSFFPYKRGGEITDDHKFVNEIMGIPTVDIINLTDRTQTGFAPHWHTHADNIEIIDRSTLKAVGQTLLQLLYETATPAS